MIRGAFFIGICFLFATPCFAAGACTTSGGMTTLNVAILSDSNFDPNASPYTPPSPSGTALANTINASIQAAFSIAPPSFQQELCNLDGIFLNPKDCANGNANSCTLSNATVFGDSWGYREHPSQVGPNGPFHRFIALSAGLWNQGNPPPILSAYENSLMSQLINWPTGANGDAHPPSYGTANPDNANMTVLAALAHEYGHILWYDTFRPTPGGAYDFSSFCRGSFFADTWKHVNPPPTWRDFGQTDGEPLSFGNENYDTKVGDLALLLLAGHYGDAQKKLHNIYRKEAHWASLFGAFSPDEDFVEIFVLDVLLNANPPLVSLPLELYDRKKNQPGPPDDIAADYVAGKKTELSRRIACFSQ